jgi:hypothetical protein
MKHRRWGTLLAATTAALTLGVMAVQPAASAQGPARLATGCSRTWHYITHGETGLNVQPVIAYYYLRADGIPGVNYWNQQFLFCRDPDWGPNHYAIYSNLTKKYWWADSGGNLWADYPSIDNPNQLFEVASFDGYWSTIRYVGDHTPYYVRPLPGSTALFAYPGQLAGVYLFRIEPPDLLG